MQARAQWSCEAGYKIDGLQESECNDKGAWTEPAPACTPIMCHTPDTPQHGNAQQLPSSLPFSCEAVEGQWLMRDRVQWSCEAGYKTDGLPGVRVQGKLRLAGTSPCLQAHHVSHSRYAAAWQLAAAA